MDMRMHVYDDACVTPTCRVITTLGAVRRLIECGNTTLGMRSLRHTVYEERSCVVMEIPSQSGWQFIEGQLGGSGYGRDVCRKRCMWVRY